MKGKKLNWKDRQSKLQTDKSYRGQIFKQLLNHLRGGYSMDCFPPLSETSIREYLKTYPDEFVEGELIDAVREGKEYWEGLGNKQSNGTCLGNSRSWYYNMVNRYGWHEKAQIETEHKGNVNVNVISYSSKKQPKPQPEAT